MFLSKSLVRAMSSSSVNTKSVNVKVISDVVWPFCYVGLRNLEKASRQANIKVNLAWEPFLLNPNIDPEGENVREHLLVKYGPRGPAMLENVIRAGRAAGIEFSHKNVYPTIKAHALMEYLKDTKGESTANQFMESLYFEYFEKDQNINSDDFLLELVGRLEGVNVAEATLALMDNSELKERVRQKDMKAKRQMRVSGVPFFIIESNKAGAQPVGFSGAQPADMIAEVLEEQVDA